MAKIVVLATGGTIAGQGADANDGVAYQAAQIDVEGLLGGICGLQDLLGADTLQGEQVELEYDYVSHMAGIGPALRTLAGTARCARRIGDTWHGYARGNRLFPAAGAGRCANCTRLAEKTGGFDLRHASGHSAPE